MKTANISSYLFAILFILFHLPLQAGSIGLESFKLKEVQKYQYQMDVQLKYQLTNYLHESLHNGVTLVSHINIDLEKKRKWWFNKNRTLARIDVSMQYHALSQHYKLVRYDTNEHWNFKSLQSALQKLGSLRTYILPKLPTYIDNGRYYIKLTADLKPDTLKFPMKVQEWFVDKYTIKTPGVVWPLP